MRKHLQIMMFLTMALFGGIPIGFAYQPAVVSAHPQASKVGMDILKKGGSAADAAIATAFALAVVEPHNSGLGGGGFFLYYDAKLERFYFLDYREVAPAKAQRSVYLADPAALEHGIRSVAVPGFVLGMETIHKKWRRVSWPAVINPALRLAEKGIPLSGLLRQSISAKQELLKQDGAAHELFVAPFEQGAHKIHQDALASTLEDIKTGGSDVFYQGALGKRIVDWMKQAGGFISAQDLHDYRVHFRRPFEFSYGDYDVATAPRPSSGGEGMKLLFRRVIIYGLEKATSNSPKTYEGLVNSFEDYFEYRLIAMRDTQSNLMAHTTHLSVIDAEGNMAAMTNTLNHPFGSGIVVPGTGIVLNNEMADFSLDPRAANQIRPGVRPLSSMSPTIVFKQGLPHLIIGTPGGTTIPQNLFQIFFNQWIWHHSLKQAIEQPKFYYSPAGKQIIVEKKIAKRIRRHLETQHPLVEEASIGNVQALWIRNEKKTIPFSDPRGEGGAVVGKP